jgi:mono/diheme cytochrome c family protein
MKLLLLAWLTAGAALCADQAVMERGRKEEARSCVACHSLRLIHSQRLPKATWDKEIGKMAGWGAKVADRQALLEYLSAEYGDDKPAPKPEMSADGTKR